MKRTHLCKAILGLFVVCTIIASSAQEAPQAVIEKMVQAAKDQRTLAADIVLTWSSSTGLKSSTGSIRLMKPNLAMIRLEGDYPLRVLASDGISRYFASDRKTYNQESIDAHGQKIDTPWWGFPFRFFFIQSLNPFGSASASSEQVDGFVDASIDGQQFRILHTHGASPMGAYKAQFFFNKDILERTIVQFGSSPGGPVFEARLSNVRINAPYPMSSFRFAPIPGQQKARISDGMLAIGVKAPDFTLHTADGKDFTLSSYRKGKKATLVNFWYYNCAPCRIEFPEFQKLYEQHEREGFAIIAVDRGDSAKVISDYAHAARLTFPIVLGGHLEKSTVFSNYKITDAFPQTYLLDGEGRVVYRAAGMDTEGLKRALQQLGIR